MITSHGIGLTCSVAQGIHSRITTGTGARSLLKVSGKLGRFHMCGKRRKPQRPGIATNDINHSCHKTMNKSSMNCCYQTAHNQHINLYTCHLDRGSPTLTPAYVCRLAASPEVGWPCVTRRKLQTPGIAEEHKTEHTYNQPNRPN